jgi:hypothetical protein
MRKEKKEEEGKEEGEEEEEEEKEKEKEINNKTERKVETKLEMKHEKEEILNILSRSCNLNLTTEQEKEVFGLCYMYMYVNTTLEFKKRLDSIVKSRFSTCRLLNSKLFFCYDADFISVFNSIELRGSVLHQSIILLVVKLHHLPGSADSVRNQFERLVHH